MIRDDAAVTNRLSFLRWAEKVGEGKRKRTIEVAVPVIDGVPLFERLAGRYPGLGMTVVAPPSNHLLGVPQFVEEERAVILAGACGHAGCCGVMARIHVSRDAVVWSEFFARGAPPLPQTLRFEFDREQYFDAVAKLPNVSALDAHTSRK